MSKEDFQNVEPFVFDPFLYVKEYYRGSENFQHQIDKEIVEWSMDTIHRLFVEGNYKGQCLLDLGSGPGLKAVITASQWFEEIFLSDISKDNVAYLTKWIEGDVGVTEALRCQMSYFALKEGKGISPEAKNEQVRKKVKCAVILDINKPQMLRGTISDGVHNFDAVIACLSMSPATQTLEGYTRTVQNISELVKPGGHFVILDTMDETSYTVGDKTFKLLCITEDEIKKAFLENGFAIGHFETHRLASPKTDLCNAETLYCVIGTKV